MAIWPSFRNSLRRASVWCAPALAFAAVWGTGTGGEITGLPSVWGADASSSAAVSLPEVATDSVTTHTDSAGTAVRGGLPDRGAVVFARNVISPWLIFSQDARESLADHWIHWNQPTTTEETAIAEQAPEAPQFPQPEELALVSAEALKESTEVTNASWETITAHMTVSAGVLENAICEFVSHEQALLDEISAPEPLTSPLVVFSRLPTDWVEMSRSPLAGLDAPEESARSRWKGQQFIQLNAHLLADYERAEHSAQTQLREETSLTTPAQSATETAATDWLPIGFAETLPELPAESRSEQSALVGVTVSVDTSEEAAGAGESTPVEYTTDEEAFVWAQPVRSGVRANAECVGCVGDCSSGNCECSSQQALRFGRRSQAETLASGAYPMPREKAPLQLIWPKRWAWAAAEDPWPRVLQAEQVPTVTQSLGSLQIAIDPAVEESVARNPVRLESDLPVARMRLHTSPVAGRMPQERNGEMQPDQPLLCHGAGPYRGWQVRSVHWNAPETTHAPLYFEEISLERSGYTRGYLQPFYSGVKFFATVPLLPGLMTIDGPTEKQYELGEDRPGSLVAYSTRRPEWTLKAILVEASVVTGLSFIIP